MYVVKETSLNTFEELVNNQTIISPDGAQHSWQITELWNDAQLEFINVYRVEPTPIPDGKMVVGYDFERDAQGVVRQVLTLAQAPALPVTPRQIRLALSQMGLRGAVENFVAQQDITVQDSWSYATEFTRDNEFVLAAAQALGKTDTDLDALFALARSL